MKLRGRFTLTLALAALVPIVLAAVVVTRVIATRYRERYAADRMAAKQKLELELARLQKQVGDQIESVADPKSEFVGSLLLDLTKLSQQGVRYYPNDFLNLRWKTRARGTRMGLSLDVFMITDADDLVIVAPSNAGAMSSKLPEIRKLAMATRGVPFFKEETIDVDDKTTTSVLVVEAAKITRDNARDDLPPSPPIAVLAGRRVATDILESVRRPNEIELRITRASGKDPYLETAGWRQLTTNDEPVRVPLRDHKNTVVATVEIAVSDGGLDSVLRNISLAAGALAVGALAAVVLLGLIVAKRTARDLDRLVQGSVAAARGDLDHRVVVRSKDEVGELANAFNLMMEDLRTSKERLVIAERIAAWQDIARRLAHEIKNPLTPIQMAMDTLMKSYKKQHPQFPEILEESTTTVLQEADRLKKIVAEFSDFARMPKPEFGRIDFNDVVRAGLSLYQGAVPIETKLEKRLPEIDADKNQINQVLLNLVENSRDAIGGREGGRISVSTQLGEAKDRVLLVVEDNGPGVPPDLKDKVFTPYFTTKHAKGGTGLGLAIVHRIVSDHGGRITISDAAGGGAKFTIELPLRNGTALLASRI